MSDKIEVKQLDPIEPKLIPYANGITMTLERNGKVYESKGFKVLEQTEDTVLIKETFQRRNNSQQGGL